MRPLIVCLWTLIAPIVLAQELHTFSNGEVADADKINENFQYLLDNATGRSGCSAQQDGSSVVITCADGTSGILASAGTIAILEGSTGLTPDISVIPSGSFYLVDGNGDALAYYGGSTLSLGAGFNIGIAGDSRLKEAAIAYFEDESRVEVTSRSGLRFSKIWYSSEDCTGPEFFDSSNSDTLVHIAEGEFGVPSGPPISTAWRSSSYPGYFNGSYVAPSEDCNAEDVIGTKHPLAEYTMPDKLVNPVFPLSVEQRP